MNFPLLNGAGEISHSFDDDEDRNLNSLAVFLSYFFKHIHTEICVCRISFLIANEFSDMKFN